MCIFPGLDHKNLSRDSCTVVLYLFTELAGHEDQDPQDRSY